MGNLGDGDAGQGIGQHGFGLHEGGLQGAVQAAFDGAMGWVVRAFFDAGELWFADGAVYIGDGDGFGIAGQPPAAVMAFGGAKVMSCAGG